MTTLTGEGKMFTRIIASLDAEVKPIPAEAVADDNDNDRYSGIPCHDTGMRYPGWCLGCIEEADSRDLIAARSRAFERRPLPAEAVCDFDDDTADDFPPTYPGWRPEQTWRRDSAYA